MDYRELAESVGPRTGATQEWVLNGSKCFITNGKEADIYIIIDELMFLMNRPTVKRQVFDLLQDLLCISRSSGVSVIGITQNPTRDTLPPSLRCNFDARIALRTATRQDSRNIIEMGGCETLPNPRTAGKAYGYYRRGGDITLYQLPYVTEEEISRLVNYWTGPAGKPRTA